MTNKDCSEILIKVDQAQQWLMFLRDHASRYEQTNRGEGLAKIALKHTRELSKVIGDIARMASDLSDKDASEDGIGSQEGE